jgi:hypothetical protein
MGKKRTAHTWGETTKRAEAMDRVIEIVSHYLPEANGVSPVEALSEITRVIELDLGEKLVWFEGSTNHDSGVGTPHPGGPRGH